MGSLSLHEARGSNSIPAVVGGFFLHIWMKSITLRKKMKQNIELTWEILIAGVLLESTRQNRRKVLAFDLVQSQ